MSKLIPIKAQISTLYHSYKKKRGEENSDKSKCEGAMEALSKVYQFIKEDEKERKAWNSH